MPKPTRSTLTVRFIWHAFESVAGGALVGLVCAMVQSLANSTTLSAATLLPQIKTAFSVAGTFGAMYGAANGVLLSPVYIPCTFFKRGGRGFLTVYGPTLAVGIVTTLIDRRTVVGPWAATSVTLVVCSMIAALKLRDDPIFGKDGHCTSCGYDLGGLAGALCPECGEPIVEAPPFNP